MSRRRQENPSVKAKQSRIYRRNQRNQIRFEAPLREFIEVKYNNIFQEYVALYNQMDAENPNKINLKRTEIFKQWKTSNEHLSSDILSVAIRETIDQDCNGASVVDVSEADGNESEANGGQSETDEDESEANGDESETDEDGGEADVSGVNEGLLAAQQVDDLVNQMMLDDEIRELLEPEDDEGIELNIEDEVDVEPFDYSLEVDIEPFDFRLEVDALRW